jgi:hypothetical protein
MCYLFDIYDYFIWIIILVQINDLHAHTHFGVNILYIIAS